MIKSSTIGRETKQSGPLRRSPCSPRRPSKTLLLFPPGQGDGRQGAHHPPPPAHCSPGLHSPDVGIRCLHADILLTSLCVLSSFCSLSNLTYLDSLTYFSCKKVYLYCCFQNIYIFVVSWFIKWLVFERYTQHASGPIVSMVSMFSRRPSPSGLTWSRCWDNMEDLETAQSTSSHNLRHFTLHLVALGVARLVPNQLQDPQEEQLVSCSCIQNHSSINQQFYCIQRNLLEVGCCHGNPDCFRYCLKTTWMANTKLIL